MHKHHIHFNFCKLCSSSSYVSMKFQFLKVKNSKNRMGGEVKEGGRLYRYMHMDIYIDQQLTGAAV